MAFLGAGKHGVSDASKLHLFASNVHAGGTLFSFAYDGAGTYKFDDSSHPTSTGTITVRVQVSPSSGTTSTPFDVTYGTATAPSGYVFDLQVKTPGTKSWTTIQNGATTGSTQYQPAKAGTYSFRARLRQATSSTKFSAWSPATTIKVT
jgi:hypothetical protein